MRANADLQSGSYLFVRPSKMKAGSIFIMREPRVEAQRRNSLFISIKQSPSRAKAGLAPTIAKTPCAGGGWGGWGGEQQLLLEEWHRAATNPGQEDFPAPSSSSKYRKILS